MGTNVMNYPRPRRWPGKALQTRFSLFDLNLVWEIDLTVGIPGIDIDKMPFN